MSKIVYINSLKQISSQEPLSDSWMKECYQYEGGYVKSIDPEYKKYFPISKIRRLGKILRRALLISKELVGENADDIDGILFGTGLGCVSSTDKILLDMSLNGESVSHPTDFMLSTHNTIASTVAIYLGINGYNSTYSDNGISFENALIDALLLLEKGECKNLLVGVFDELTDNFYTLVSKSKVLGDISTYYSEVAMGFKLSSIKTDNSRVELKGVKTLYKPNKEKLIISLNQLLKDNKYSLNNVDALIFGYNGDDSLEKEYNDIALKLFPKVSILHYKHIFGEGFSASAMGIYVGAVCLSNNNIPEILYKKKIKEVLNPKVIIVLNIFNNKNYSLTLLSSCIN